ncbi:MAG: hypothetical protein V4582_16470 [Pseudomonadota bacterium]
MKYFKVPEKDNPNHFVDLEKVEAVSCKTVRTGGGVNVASLAGDGEPQISPVVVTPVITLHLAGGDHVVRFGDFKAAEGWLENTFGISVSFDKV